MPWFILVFVIKFVNEPSKVIPDALHIGDIHIINDSNERLKVITFKMSCGLFKKQAVMRCAEALCGFEFFFEFVIFFQRKKIVSTYWSKKLLILSHTKQELSRLSIYLIRGESEIPF